MIVLYRVHATDSTIPCFPKGFLLLRSPPNVRLKLGTNNVNLFNKITFLLDTIPTEPTAVGTGRGIP